MRVDFDTRTTCRKCGRARDDVEDFDRALVAGDSVYAEARDPCPQCGSHTVRVDVDVRLE